MSFAATNNRRRLMMMMEKRRHKRFSMDLIEINSKLNLVSNVEIVDMSFGGVALKVNRRLNIGNEVLLTLKDKVNSIDVRGMVVRCNLKAIEKRFNGGKVSIYTAGMRFKEDAEDKIAAFVREAILA
jgi:Tfp pilus assembly protein PilZ